MSNKENETRENSQNRNKENHTSKNFIAGAFIGGVVGAAAALLLAPKAGKEFRSGLNDQMNNLLEKTTLLSDDVFEKSNGLAAATKEKTALLSKAVVQQSKELVNKAKGFTSDSIDEQEESETSYIPINRTTSKVNNAKDDVKTSAEKETDIRKKLEEAQRAFDEAENSIK
jgi:gas vesicle protein